jgi:hypothetical protein
MLNKDTNVQEGEAYCGKVAPVKNRKPWAAWLIVAQFKYFCTKARIYRIYIIYDFRVCVA